MLLKPSVGLLRFLKTECQDWEHPQHYGTYMPEQEYLGRLLAVVDEECVRNYDDERTKYKKRELPVLYPGFRNVSSTARTAGNGSASTCTAGNDGDLDTQEIIEIQPASPSTVKHQRSQIRPQGWRHLGPQFNFEIDTNVRIPFDFSDEHKRLATSDDEVVVYHFSGSDCKPWESIVMYLKSPRRRREKE